MANSTKGQRESTNKFADYKIASEISSNVKLAIANNKLELKNVSDDDFKKIKFGYDTAIKLTITALNNIVAKYEDR